MCAPMIRCNGGRSGAGSGRGPRRWGASRESLLRWDERNKEFVWDKFLFNFMSSESKVKSYFAADNVDDRLSDF